MAVPLVETPSSSGVPCRVVARIGELEVPLFEVLSLDGDRLRVRTAFLLEPGEDVALFVDGRAMIGRVVAYDESLPAAPVTELVLRPAT